MNKYEKKLNLKILGTILDIKIDQKTIIGRVVLYDKNKNLLIISISNKRKKCKMITNLIYNLLIQNLSLL